MTTAVPRLRLASSRGGTRGSPLCSSMIARAPSARTPALAAATMAGDAQPRFGPSTRANTTRVTPRVALNAPGRSKLRWVSGRRSAGISRNAASTATVARGTLTKNTASQPNAWVRTPPSSTPTTSPAAPAPPQTATARLRARPSAKVVLTSDRVAGNTSAPPRPCAARAPSRNTAPGASPPRKRAAGVEHESRHEHPAPSHQVGGAAAEEQEACGCHGIALITDCSVWAE